MIDKEDKAKIYHFCQSLKKELRNYRVTIERIGAGEGIEGVYEFSNVKELPDNPLSELPEKEQNAYIGHWFEAFKEVFMKARDLGSW
jgi:glucokinase